MRVQFDIFDDDRFVESIVRDLGEVRIGSLNLEGWLHVPDEGVARLHAIVGVEGTVVRLANLVGDGRTMVNGVQVGLNHELASDDMIRLGPRTVLVVTFPVENDHVVVEYIPPLRRW